MLARLVTLGVRGLVNGPARSWVFTSGALALMRFVRARTGRRELIDLSSSKPGDKFVIEHLDITHQEQIKQMKAEKRADKRQAKAAKRAERAARRAARAS